MDSDPFLEPAEINPNDDEDCRPLLIETEPEWESEDESS